MLAESAVGAAGVACVGTLALALVRARMRCLGGFRRCGRWVGGFRRGVPGDFWTGVDGLAEARAGDCGGAVWVALPTALPGVAATC